MRVGEGILRAVQKRVTGETKTKMVRTVPWGTIPCSCTRKKKQNTIKPRLLQREEKQSKDSTPSNSRKGCFSRKP